MFEQIRPSRPGDGEGMARVWLSAGAYFVDALVVHRAVWRQGIGTALLAAAESWGGDRGASIVRLTTYAEGPVAVPFYERHVGYERRSILFQKPLT